MMLCGQPLEKCLPVSRLLKYMLEGNNRLCPQIESPFVHYTHRVMGKVVWIAWGLLEQYLFVSALRRNPGAVGQGKDK